MPDGSAEKTIETPALNDEPAPANALMLPIAPPTAVTDSNLAWSTTSGVNYEVVVALYPFLNSNIFSVLIALSVCDPPYG